MTHDEDHIANSNEQWARYQRRCEMLSMPHQVALKASEEVFEGSIRPWLNQNVKNRRGKKKAWDFGVVSTGVYLVSLRDAKDAWNVVLEHERRISTAHVVGKDMIHEEWFNCPLQDGLQVVRWMRANLSPFEWNAGLFMIEKSAWSVWKSSTSNTPSFRICTKTDNARIAAMMLKPASAIEQ